MGLLSILGIGAASALTGGTIAAPLMMPLKPKMTKGALKNKHMHIKLVLFPLPMVMLIK